MDWQRLSRNWFWPIIGAAALATAQALAAGEMDWKTLLALAIGGGLTKFNGLAGKKEKWMSHDTGDYTDPHRV